MNRNPCRSIFEADATHGDDPCIGPDGKDVYAHVKERGMFRSIPRTEGVSTTEIVGRMLQMTKSHHRNRLSSDDETSTHEHHYKECSQRHTSNLRRRYQSSEYLLAHECFVFIFCCWIYHGTWSRAIRSARPYVVDVDISRCLIQTIVRQCR